MGFSSKFSVRPAACSAVARARENLGSTTPETALVFATAAWGPSLSDLLEAVRHEVGGCRVFGASVAGLFADGEGTADNPAVAVALLAGVEVESVLLEDLAADDPDSGEEMIDHFARRPGEGDLLFVMLDLHRRSPGPLLGGLARVLEAGLVVGLGASALSGGDAMVWRDDQIAAGALLAVLLRGGAAATRWGVAQGCRAVSEVHTVTRARDRWISSLDGRPALGVLREVAGRAHLPANAESLRQLMVGITCSPERNTFDEANLLRNIVGVDPRRDAILLPAEVEPGSQLRFALRDAVAARENLETLVEEQLGAGGGGLGLYVSGSSLDYAGERGAGRDARCFQAYAPRFPVLGLRGSQMLGPVGSRGTVCAALNDCGLLAVANS